MARKTKVIEDHQRPSDTLKVRTSADNFYIDIEVEHHIELDAAGVGVLVGALTQWLADRADRL